MKNVMRDTLRELAEQAAPPRDLTAGAIARGRHLRRRRQAVIGGAAALLLAAVVAPFAIRGRTQTAPPVAPSPVPSYSPAAWSDDKPYELPGGWVITGLSDDDDPPTLLDPETRKYRTVQQVFPRVAVSPDGRFAAVGDDQHTGLGILDVTTGKIRWTGLSAILEPQWSPDSTRILLTGNERFTVLKAGTGQPDYTTFDVPDAYPCTDFCQFTWLPGGREVALALVAGGQTEEAAAPVLSLTVFDAETGDVTRSLPVHGSPTAENAWSPDGRLVLVRGEGKDFGQTWVVETSTGRVRGKLPAGGPGAFVAADLILRFSGYEALLYDPAGTELQRWKLPPEAQNYRVSIGPGS